MYLDDEKEVNKMKKVKYVILGGIIILMLVNPVTATLKNQENELTENIKISPEPNIPSLPEYAAEIWLWYEHGFRSKGNDVGIEFLGMKDEVVTGGTLITVGIESWFFHNQYCGPSINDVIERKNWTPPYKLSVTVKIKLEKDEVLDFYREGYITPRAAKTWLGGEFVGYSWLDTGLLVGYTTYNPFTYYPRSEHPILRNFKAPLQEGRYTYKIEALIEAPNGPGETPKDNRAYKEGKFTIIVDNSDNLPQTEVPTNDILPINPSQTLVTKPLVIPQTIQIPQQISIDKKALIKPVSKQIKPTNVELNTNQIINSILPKSNQQAIESVSVILNGFVSKNM